MTPITARELFLWLEKEGKGNQLQVPPAPIRSLSHGDFPTTEDLRQYWQHVKRGLIEWANLVDQELPP